MERATLKIGKYTFIVEIDKLPKHLCGNNELIKDTLQRALGRNIIRNLSDKIVYDSKI